MPERVREYRPPGFVGTARSYERAERRQADKNFYSSTRWRRFRDWFLARHPLCAKCDEAGRTTLAAHVHHVKPRRERPDLAFVESNCEALCIPCHNAEEIR
jgi:5-methylcytosine-specific restriction protein A